MTKEQKLANKEALLFLLERMDLLSNKDQDKKSK